MKYSHVIYNSSEKNRSGGVGFGVRSASPGISPQLLSAMEQNGIFSFRDSNVSISPAALFENPDIIKQTPPSYFFQSIALQGQEKAYVLGRKIAVGFDYTFYLNGKPGRLGNYVVDTYVFPHCPMAEDFEILLERPAAGSNRFIPTDPAPRNDNEEMREISTGHKPDLNEVEKPFKSNDLPVIDQQTIDLLFAFIESRKLNKPLLIKGATKDAPRLMAGLAMMMPQQYIKDITFVTNHNDQARVPGINIFFISENFRFEIFPNLWVILDINKGQHPDTQEYGMFAPMVEDYLRAGRLESIHKLVGWCLSETYEASKTAPHATQKALFTFVNDYPAFDITLLETDAKLRELLAGYLSKHPEEMSKLEDTLQNEFDRVGQHDELKIWIDFIRNIRPVDMKALVEKNKKKINDIIFHDTRAFASFYKTYRNIWPEITKDFIETARFNENNDFLSSLKGSDWEELYGYFLTKAKTDKAALVWRMLDDGLDHTTRERVIQKEIPDKKSQGEVFINLLNTTMGDYDSELIPMIVAVSRELKACPDDFFKVFASKTADSKYADLFTCGLEMAYPSSARKIEEFIRNLDIFMANPESGKWLTGKNGTDTLKSLLTYLGNNLKNGTMPKEKGAEISDRIAELPVSREIRDRYTVLAQVLRHTQDYEERELRDLWNVAAHLGDKPYMSILAPDYLAYIERYDAESIYKQSPEYPTGLVDFLIEGDILSEEEILAYAAKSRYRNFYYLPLMKRNGGKAKDEYEYLTQKCGLNENEALRLLERVSPESYKKILKSMQPSIWSKIANGIKGLFAKKEAKDETPDDKKNGGTKSENTQEKAGKTATNKQTNKSRRR